MNLIKQEIFNTQIPDQYVWNFTLSSNGIYVMLVSAKCKNWLQNYRRLFHDDDLAIQIDEYLFAEIKGKKKEFASAGSWNGNEIKGNTKDILFILPIKAGAHEIKFWVDGKPILEEIQIYEIKESEIDVVGSNTAGSHKFVDVISKNLKIENLKINARAEIGSKISIKVDGTVQKNPKYKKFAKWYWYGKELEGSSKEYAMQEIWDEDVHSIQLCAKGNPEIKSIRLKIDIENVIYSSGVVRLYKDIVIRDDINLRSAATNESESLLMLQDGEKLEITNERVLGKYIENLSEIWHEVIVRNTKGYVLSSYVEIEGQDRERIIDLIKEKCNQYSVDANIILAIAGRESHFKPFAQSYKGPLGIFQLSKDTRNDFGVIDPYDIYQNIEGGIKNYKDIEKRITGRGDILIKRLAAWHDGPTITIKKLNNKTFDYDKLSEQTKIFIQNVLANLKKKDWSNIIYLPTITLFLVGISFFWGGFNGTSNTGVQMANVIHSDVPTAYENSLPEVIDKSIKTTAHKNGLSVSAIFDFRKYETKDEASYFPNVFFDENSNQVIFLNSEGVVVKKIDPRLLNTDKLLEIDPLDSFDLVGIGSVVLENPKNIFYFSAVNSYGCGASNCNWALYRFDANEENLKIIELEIFGQVMGLYLSPDLKHLVVTGGSSAGLCFNSSDLYVFDTLQFNKQEILGFNDDSYTSENLEELIWKNDKKVQFIISYSQCPIGGYRKITWLYDMQDQKITKFKSEDVQFNP